MQFVEAGKSRLSLRHLILLRLNVGKILYEKEWQSGLLILNFKHHMVN